ncbi:LacI family transcriptional regulator [Agromyces atrinae]|uniref:LacI family DNA-binding transcriptional regulator n=1 Tax=Agromyces atrinae TaxID=592376 RepID=UPI001F57CACC|nr:LacI family DNA-binding transcriptional regulator [Agromyces atrinae]MCI2956745.1 LacI family transcriptional regulator [Agromyces atrinae]
MTTPNPKRRATVHDVARVAGISHATVSRYLNKRAYVSQASAEAIEAAIRSVNYTPNRTARSLVTQSTRAVAFVVREYSEFFFADSNLSAMAAAANKTLSAEGYQMLLVIIESDEAAERIVDLIIGGFVDGALLVAMRDDDPVAEAIARSTIPAITASAPELPVGLPSVDTDNAGGSRAITRLLADSGRTRLAEIAGPAPMPAARLRHDGFVEARGAAYEPSLSIAAAEWSVEAGAAAMRELLERGEPIDGVVAASDALAAGAIDAIHAAGLTVPADIAVVGFDDSPWATRIRPTLTTVRQDPGATGRRMAERMMAHLGGEALDDVAEVIPNVIVERESTAPGA